jgi:hypothetical protein
MAENYSGSHQLCSHSIAPSISWSKEGSLKALTRALQLSMLWTKCMRWIRAFLTLLKALPVVTLWQASVKIYGSWEIPVRYVKNLLTLYNFCTCKIWGFHGVTTQKTPFFNFCTCLQSVGGDYSLQYFPSTRHTPGSVPYVSNLHSLFPFSPRYQPILLPKSGGLVPLITEPSMDTIHRNFRTFATRTHFEIKLTQCPATER